MNALGLIQASVVTAEAVAPTTPVDLTELIAKAVDFPDAPPTRSESSRQMFIHEHIDVIRLSLHTEHPIYFQSGIPGVGAGTRVSPRKHCLDQLNMMQSFTFRWRDGKVWPHCFRSGDWRTVIGFENNVEFGNLGRMRVIQLRGARLPWAKIADVFSKYADNFPASNGTTRAMRIARKSKLASELEYAQRIGNVAPVDDTAESKATLAQLVQHVQDTHGPIRRIS